MKPVTRQTIGTVLAGLLCISQAVALHAAILDSNGIVSILQQANDVLAKADNDYGGHRIAAMKDVAAASRLLGKNINVSNTDAGKEKQTLSDLQLRSVQMTLLQVSRAVPPGANQGAIVGDINGAINELSQGLALADAKTKPSTGASTRPAARAGRSQAAPNPVGNNSVEAASLARIYEILSVADHDYKGHRIKAMEAIAKACQHLGSGISGDGRGKEKQTVSDSQLHEAQHLLEQVRNSFVGRDPKAVLADINEAVQQLSTALSIR